MTPWSSTLIAYGVITVLLWGYAGHLFLSCRRMARSSGSASANVPTSRQ